MLKLFENLRKRKNREQLNKALSAKIESLDGRHTVSLEDFEKFDKDKDGEKNVSTQPKK